MNKLIFTLLFTFVYAFSFAQNNSYDSFKLYPTTNMWTFLKLDTSNGKIWQVQFDVQGSNRFELNLNPYSLVSFDDMYNGRFELYPTQNMYNFLLLDKKDGKVWQAQWSNKKENRGIIEIKSE